MTPSLALERLLEPAPRAAVGVLLLVAACASNPEEPALAYVDDASAPEESPRITLVLFPIWEAPVDENGFGPAGRAGPSEGLPLSGVRVCVAKKRPYNGAWRDFEETDGPCATSEEGQNLVLEGVPGLSELIVTATKDGYRPSAFGVTTWQWDMDVTAGNPDQWQLTLRRSDATLPRIDPAVTVDSRMGDFVLWTCAKGTSVTLEPNAGDGPFAHTEGWAASFVNLPEGEYVARVEHPRASCRVSGDFGTFGGPVFGFSRTGHLIGVPILEGYSAPAIRATCACLVDGVVRFDVAFDDHCVELVDGGADVGDAGPDTRDAAP